MGPWLRERASIAWGLLTIALLTLLVGTALRIYNVMDRSSTAERQIRAAQLARSRTMRLQLDEQSSLRGYFLSNRPSAMVRYAQAQRLMPQAIRNLEQLTLATVGAPALHFVHDEEATNRAWVRLRDAALLGDALVARFRGDDAALSAALSSAAERADAQARQDARVVLWFTLGSAGAVFLIIVAAASLHRRALLDALRQRTAYLEERRVADALQRVIARERLPVVPDLTLDAVFLPAEGRVGGDWYDVVPMPDGSLFFSMGDVMGHGLDAASTMLTVRGFLLAFASEGGAPGAVLERANRALCLHASNALATALCGSIAADRSYIDYALAGHPPPLFMTREGARFSASGEPPLGVFEQMRYATHRESAGEVSAVVLYSDGLIECDRDVLAGSDALVRAAVQAMGRGASSPARALLSAVAGDRVPVDDISVLCIALAHAAIRQHPGHEKAMRQRDDGAMTNVTWKPPAQAGLARDRLPASAFAFPKERKEPLTDAAHVRSAIARFAQVDGVTADERGQALGNIRAAAAYFGVRLR